MVFVVIFIVTVASYFFGGGFASALIRNGGPFRHDLAVLISGFSTLALIIGIGFAAAKAQLYYYNYKLSELEQLDVITINYNKLEELRQVKEINDSIPDIDLLLMIPVDKDPIKE